MNFVKQLLDLGVKQYVFLDDNENPVMVSDLLDFHRSDDWWKRGENLYLDNFAKAGFTQTEQSQLKQGDVILMTINSSVPNHGALYLGDGLILHHVHGRLSTREVFGGYYLKNATHYLRYENS